MTRYRYFKEYSSEREPTPRFLQTSLQISKTKCCSACPISEFTKGKLEGFKPLRLVFVITIALTLIIFPAGLKFHMTS